MRMDSRRSTAYWLMGYALFLLLMGSSIPSPLYEDYRRTWHLQPDIITLVFATYTVLNIATLLLFGQLSDQLGRRKIIALGLAVGVAATLCFALASSLAWLFVARALQGIAIGTASGALTASLVELHPRRERQAAALVTSLATTGGVAVGTLLAGILAQYGPWPLVLPYLVQLGLLVPAFAGVWLMPETVTRRPGANRWHLSRPHVPAAIHLPFGLSGATSFLAWAVAALFLALVPTYITLLLHLANLALSGGALFLIFGMSALTQGVLRRLPPQPAMSAALLLLIAGLACTVLAVPAHSLPLLLAGTLVEGGGHGLAWMGSLKLLTLRAD